MTHIHKPMIYLIEAWSATYFLTHLWECVRDEKFEAAMTAQFLYLDHRDNANEAMATMTPEEHATLEGMVSIADGEPA